MDDEPRSSMPSAPAGLSRALGSRIQAIDTLEIPAPSEEHSGRTIALYKLPAKYAAEALAQLAGSAN